MISKFKNFLLEKHKNQEIFSAYNGRYLFNVTDAYRMIDSRKINATIKKYSSNFLNQFSHQEFSQVDPNKIKKLKDKIDYEKPLGLLVKFKNPEVSNHQGEWILIDGNHRVRIAAESGNSGKLWVIENPNETEKFMSTDTGIPHELFPDY